MDRTGKYELLYIVHPDLESSIDKITERVHSFIESRGGKVSYEENWGKRKLSYEIKKTEVGIYILTYFESPKEALSKIERDLRLTEEIIRFMVLATIDRVKTSKDVKPAKETKETKVDEKEEKPKAKKAKKEVEPVEGEDERMKKLDEKLGELLGEEEDNKEEVKAEAKPAKKASTKAKKA